MMAYARSMDLLLCVQGTWDTCEGKCTRFSIRCTLLCKVVFKCLLFFIHMWKGSTSWTLEQSCNCLFVREATLYDMGICATSVHWTAANLTTAGKQTPVYISQVQARLLHMVKHGATVEKKLNIHHLLSLTKSLLTLRLIIWRHMMASNGLSTIDIIWAVAILVCVVIFNQHIALWR